MLHDELLASSDHAASSYHTTPAETGWLMLCCVVTFQHVLVFMIIITPSG